MKHGRIFCCCLFWAGLAGSPVVLLASAAPASQPVLAAQAAAVPVAKTPSLAKKPPLAKTPPLAKKPPASNMPPAAAKHMGVATCASSVCHGSAVAQTQAELAFNEYVIWSQEDPHAQTFYTLLTPAAKRITEKLGLPAPQSAPVCLACHVDFVPPEQRGPRFQLSDGVGCEACHGGAEAWLQSHTRKGVTHADNLANGLYPLDNMPRRAARCMACHVGNAEQFAGHDIMGAGHPRLQFELVNWSTLQHPHFTVDADYLARKAVPDAATQWAIGQLQAAHTLLSTLDSPRLSAGGLWVELAFFDCHACHAPMNANKWRPRADAGALGPGRVRLNDSALLVATLLVSARDAKNGRAMQAALQQLHRASQEGREVLQAAARTLDALVMQHQQALAGQALTTGEAKNVLTALMAAAVAGTFNDYLTAEQVAMAVDILLRASAPQKYQGVAPQLDAVFDTLKDQNNFQADAFFAAMAVLQKRL